MSDPVLATPPPKKNPGRTTHPPEETPVFEDDPGPALGGITQQVAAHIAHTGEGADGTPVRPLHDLLTRDLLFRVQRFSEPQHCYGDPHKAAQTVRDLAEQLRHQAR